jgi:hypothetical protein
MYLRFRYKRILLQVKVKEPLIYCAEVGSNMRDD